MADALLIGSTPTESSLEARLDGFVDLFRSLSRPGDRTVQGLWAELAIILWSHDPARAITAWHSSPQTLHDFAAGVERLEVKSTSAPLREHAFALDQLLTPAGGHVVVASLILDETDAGESVGDLTSRIEDRIANLPESRRRLQTVVAQSLGRGWREAANLRFDLQAAQSKLRFYDARSLPCVALPIPEEIKRVDLVVDVSLSPCLTIANARKLSSFFDAVLSDA